ncbi:hypothetical protein P8625_02200 [Tenacibaculum tangerinum]|uniref:Uncharacterized protein n=1 Tax=Tenacibaculum tangerinum TaxID=3038772 RepID=A0ABY8L3J1_9FLAO|nr:hypothetical protein [Tenacibaculum tangerinum]WGH76001.1 hypothetical protein P8625_02200 [Tenacibaculum tangerinum]
MRGVKKKIWYTFLANEPAGARQNLTDPDVMHSDWNESDYFKKSLFGGERKQVKIKQQYSNKAISSSL